MARRYVVSNLILQLEEQQADLRSREKTYRFTAENRGSKSVSLHPLVPQIPDGVELLDVKDTSERAVLLKRSMLCTEMTEVLKAYVRRGDKGGSATIVGRFWSKNEPSSPKPVSQVVRSHNSDGTEADIDFTI